MNAASDPTDTLSETALRAFLADAPFVAAVHYFPSIPSTNDWLKQMATRGAPEGTLAVADEQTAGRGRLSRKWIAPRDSSLLFSLLFRPKIAAEQSLALTMICSLAVRDAVRDMLGVEIRLKWPNDLVYEGRKCGGLLAEASVEAGAVDYIVVGTGINVNWDPSGVSEFDQPATSLSNIVGRAVSRPALLRAILVNVAGRYAKLRSGLLPNAEWEEALDTIGQAVVVTVGSERLEGVAAGTDSDGALLLCTPAGETRRITAGDVRVRPVSTGRLSSQT